MNYKNILQLFSENQLPYAVIGTWALKELYPQFMNDYRPKDCDLLIPNEPDIVRQFLNILEKNNWNLTLWGTPIRSAVSSDKLKGKFYVRAEKASLQLDITYENEYFSWEDISMGSHVCNQIHYASLDLILFLKRCKKSERSDSIIKRFDAFNDDTKSQMIHV